eukprot:570721-Rhodomonas_salina.2
MELCGVPVLAQHALILSVASLALDAHRRTWQMAGLACARQPAAASSQDAASTSSSHAVFWPRDTARSAASLSAPDTSLRSWRCGMPSSSRCCHSPRSLAPPAVQIARPASKRVVVLGGEGMAERGGRSDGVWSLRTQDDPQAAPRPCAWRMASAWTLARTWALRISACWPGVCLTHPRAPSHIAPIPHLTSTMTR